ncbi:baseplate J/gp47 family protein [Sphingomonas sp. HF-S4]|uniref:Baseplate J/gp47 family protein n=1 Tax=Sphingomonas agrestis TaxID=3080540 RepID=A0ABU3Y4U4_9SPHN|nr:baseplate J/gp47 family protein [Sphingomonas sp. HF-S4]MDV3456329.1 baseplate J/gp47 family protein [Sphingomonas sp. HF-S4]
MPLPAPRIDDRDYRALVEETLARVPVHTPEWTNFNPSDPGVTIVQLFAFLTENLIYRANLIPERNRAKFLQLLGIPLRTASEARGLVAFANEKGALATQTIQRDFELLAGAMPFRTVTGLDVLPVEAKLFVKRPVANPAPELRKYYELLYASYGATLPAQLTLYQSAPFDPAQGPLDLAETIDRTLWIALVARKDDLAATDDPTKLVREAIAGRNLSLGLAPAEDVEQLAIPVGGATTAPADLLRYDIARPAANGELLFVNGRPAPDWRALDARADFDPSREVGVVEIGLPEADALRLWNNLDPFEAGVGELPPAIDDSAIAETLVTWIRVRASSAAEVRLRWAGINAVGVRQFETIRAERLADGDGSPDQVRQLAKAPVLENSVAIVSVSPEGTETEWSAIDDLLAAAPEVPIPGASQQLGPATSFRVDAEAGVVSFGDGLAGRRPGADERLYARYEYSEGQEGNVGPHALKAGPLAPGGFTATNPIATWGGTDAESVRSGEKQVQRMLQHRDRLVTEADFRSIAWRTPGVSIGRIDVLPAWHPDLAPGAIGTVPGVVTLLVAPRNDPEHPAAPRPDAPFLDALCAYLDPRRLVTTELVLRGPAYKRIWVSVGIEVGGGYTIAEVADAVKARLRAYLSPLPPEDSDFSTTEGPLYGPATDPALRGWPLGRPVHARALMAEAARVPGVVEVADIQLALDTGGKMDAVPITGIELPELAGISVVGGDPIDISLLRGDLGSGGTGSGTGDGSALLPVPVVAETC